MCDVDNGYCANGCDDGDPDGYLWRGAWHGPGCQIGNYLRICLLEQLCVCVCMFVCARVFVCV